MAMQQQSNLELGKRDEGSCLSGNGRDLERTRRQEIAD
jgi:hypothetical protein